MHASNKIARLTKAIVGDLVCLAQATPFAPREFLFARALFRFLFALDCFLGVADSFFKDLLPLRRQLIARRLVVDEHELEFVSHFRHIASL